MDIFIQNIVSFPTVIFTIVLGVAVLYWLTAMLGLVEIDALDFDVDPDFDAGAELDVEGSGQGLAGVLMRLGLNGVPITLVLTVMALVGWLFCYFASHLLLRHLPLDILRYAAGSGVVFAALFVSVPITAVVIRPFRPLFKRAQTMTVKRIIGQVALVRTSTVSDRFGEATVDDGGAGLIIQVRDRSEKNFTRGDRVVLLEYMETESAYRIISEAEFNGETS